MRFKLSYALIGLVAFVAIGAFFTAHPATSLQALDPAATATKDVTLVIDYGATSGRSIDVIDLNQVTNAATGWDVLLDAQAKVQGTDQYPTGFVCRINGWPTAADQDCRETPKANQGHWAYFVSNLQLGKGWILSGQGASAHIPDCGGFEGWSWVAAGETATPPRYSVSTRGCK